MARKSKDDAPLTNGDGACMEKEAGTSGERPPISLIEESSKPATPSPQTSTGKKSDLKKTEEQIFQELMQKFVAELSVDEPKDEQVAPLRSAHSS